VKAKHARVIGIVRLKKRRGPRRVLDDIAEVRNSVFCFQLKILLIVVRRGSCG
jgi:hypothetical protein